MRKKLLQLAFFWVTCLGASPLLFGQGVGINDDNTSPDASAMLDVKSTNKGVLIPRVALSSTAVAAPVATPATSLMVYNTATAGDVTPGFYYWNGTVWVRVATGSASNDWTLTGNTGTNPATNFVGTTNAVDFVTRTNNVERMRVTSAGRVGIGTNAPAELLHLVGGGMRVDGDFGIGFRIAPSVGLPTTDGARIHMDENFGGVNNDYLIIEKSDFNQVPADGGIAFVNRGSDNVRTLSMVIPGSGNVGINTMTPAERLHVVGNIRSSALAGAGVRLVSSDANGTLTNFANGANGQVLTIAAGVPTWAAPATTTDDWKLLGNAGTNAALNFIGTSDNVDFVTRTNNLERLRVTAAGNLGVGTTTPGERLHVVGGIRSSNLAGATTRIVTSDNNGTLTNFANGANGQVLTIAAGVPTWAAPATTNWTLTGNTGTNAATNFVGTTDAVDFVTRTSNTERMRVTSAGNLGVGTTTPAERLHVVGNVRTSSLAGVGSRIVSSDANGTLTNVAAGVNGQVLTMVAGAPSWAAPATTNWTLTGNTGTNAATNFVGTTDAVDFVTRTSNTERMRVTSAGNLGVGTTTPAERLHVVGNVRTSSLAGVGSRIVSSDANGTLTNVAAGVNGQVLTMVAGAPSWAAPATTNWTLTGNTGTNAATNFVGTTDAVDFVTRTSNTERMRVTSAGRVGIGTNAPATRFQVTDNLGSFQFDAATVTSGYTSAIRLTDAAMFVEHNSTTDRDMRFRTNGADNMAIDWTTGNIGINTIAPAERLHVVGNIRTSSLAGVGTRLVSSNANGTLTNFANGANGQVLTIAAGVPTWAAPATTNWTLTGNTGTNAATNFVGTADAVDFVTRTSNTERMRITAAGNVGVGIVAPSERLHVNGGGIRVENEFGVGFRESPNAIAPSTDGARIHLDENFGGASSDFLLIEKTDVNGLQPDGGIAFTNRGSDNVRNLSMAIRGSGNVGINTMTPAERLHVVGNIRTSSLAGVGTRLVSSDANGTLTNFANGANGQVLTIAGGVPTWAAPAATNWALTGNAAVATDFIGTTNAIDFVTRTNNAERMRVTAAGNVGVGTNAPTHLMQITQGGVTAATNPQLRISNTTNAGGATAGIRLNTAGWDVKLQTVQNTDWLQLTDANGNVQHAWHGARFYAGSSSADGANTGYITGNGTNLGIGTAPTTHRLTVNGTMHALGEVRAFNNNTVFRRSNTPFMFADVFDPNFPSTGVHIANNESEEGGFWANGNYAMVYSPGDNDLVKFVDEDFWDGAGNAYDNNALRARIDGAGQYFQISDAHQKENITRIGSSLSKVMAISGYTYDFKRAPSEIEKNSPILHGAGILAQEVEKVLPEAVSKQDGNYMVNYAAFVPLFIEAFKEQQLQVQQLQNENAALKTQLEELKTMRKDIDDLKKSLEEKK